MITYTNTKFQEHMELLTQLDELCTLIVWNDEVNSFEWVIETLVDVCGHTPEQAEQCAIIIDSKGKYAVKEGSATIEVIAN
jgi:ATP-dependent Clp protease adaptor protein ClpS